MGGALSFVPFHRRTWPSRLPHARWLWSRARELSSARMLFTPFATHSARSSSLSAGSTFFFVHRRVHQSSTMADAAVVAAAKRPSAEICVRNL